MRRDGQVNLNLSCSYTRDGLRPRNTEGQDLNHHFSPDGPTTFNWPTAEDTLHQADPPQGLQQLPAGSSLTSP